MSITALQEYIRYAKYARHLPELNRRETWTEQIDRVFEMHERQLGLDVVENMKDDLAFAKRMILQKKILGSQRALQFGGDPIMDKNARIFNCVASYCDRPRFFQECIWLLLCGAGCGFSVQYKDVDKLPIIKCPDGESVEYSIPDSIEGWADAIGILISSYVTDHTAPFPEYQNKHVTFDYSLIRPAGAPVSGGAKAPGPDMLKVSIENIRTVLTKAASDTGKLKTIDAYDIVMHLSEAVLSGGIRRSACIAIFSPDDDDMATAKIGSWRKEFKHRARSNNSALLIRDKTTKEQFSKLMTNVKEFGEPGFIWADHEDTLFNPCCEIAFVAKLDLTDDLREKYKDEIKIQDNTESLSGWNFCNLCEINSKKANTEEKFYDACKAAAIIGTIQASYTKFDYLGPITQAIVEKEALLGVSMTGMADSPDIAFNADIQKRGAEIVLETNERIADIIGINYCARGTCVKPSGSTSCILGSASGIHPHHAKRYFRRVQANKVETPVKYFKQFNPLAVEQSLWGDTDEIITFLCEVPDGAKTKNTVNAMTLLNNVKLTQQNWVEFGTRHDVAIRPWLRNNVSNTIHVKPDEWDEVEQYIFDNRKWFAGISLLPVTGDKDYPQSPFTAVYTPFEMVRQYGDASVFASGIIETALSAFDGDLWAASDCIIGIGQDLNKEEYVESEYIHLLRVGWIKQATQFANRYFDGDIRRMTYCLKDVFNWKTWCDLKREYVDVDWSGCFEDVYGSLDFGGAGEACAGGACELGELGATMKEHLK